MAGAPGRGGGRAGAVLPLPGAAAAPAPGRGPAGDAAGRGGAMPDPSMRYACFQTSHNKSVRIDDREARNRAREARSQAFQAGGPGLGPMGAGKLRDRFIATADDPLQAGRQVQEGGYNHSRSLYMQHRQQTTLQAAGPAAEAGHQICAEKHKRAALQLGAKVAEKEGLPVQEMNKRAIEALNKSHGDARPPPAQLQDGDPRRASGLHPLKKGKDEEKKRHDLTFFEVEKQIEMASVPYREREALKKARQQDDTSVSLAEVARRKAEADRVAAQAAAIVAAARARAGKAPAPAAPAAPAVCRCEEICTCPVSAIDKPKPAPPPAAAPARPVAPVEPDMWRNPTSGVSLVGPKPETARVALAEAQNAARKAEKEAAKSQAKRSSDVEELAKKRIRLDPIGDEAKGLKQEFEEHQQQSQLLKGLIAVGKEVKVESDGRYVFTDPDAAVSVGWVPGKSEREVRKEVEVTKREGKFGLTYDHNCIIIDVVPGGPAALAGLKVGQELIQVNRKQVRKRDDVALHYLSAPDTFRVEVKYMLEESELEDLKRKKAMFDQSTTEWFLNRSATKEDKEEKEKKDKKKEKKDKKEKKKEKKERKEREDKMRREVGEDPFYDPPEQAEKKEGQAPPQVPPQGWRAPGERSPSPDARLPLEHAAAAAAAAAAVEAGGDDTAAAAAAQAVMDALEEPPTRERAPTPGAGTGEDGGEEPRDLSRG